MKTATKIVVVAAMVAMGWSGPGIAHDGEGWALDRCGPAGTWFGQNETYGFEYLITVVPMGGGCYSAVAEGIGNEVPPWEQGTSWRGVITKTGDRSYSIVQLQLAGPSQLQQKSGDRPDVAAARGELTMVDCNHFEVEFGLIGIYAWGQTPLVDEAMATYPPSIASYTRLSGDCDQSSVDR
jgi:hypothetical protein